MTVASAPARPGRAVAWLALIAIVAVAGAGLVTSLDHAGTEVGRPELTARGHALVAARLAILDAPLADLAAAVDATAAHGRDVLTSLRGLDPTATTTAVEAGYGELPRLSSALAAVTGVRAGLLEGTTSDTIPVSDILRVRAIDAAIAAAGTLPADWAEVAASADAPLTLIGVLDTHDHQVLEATDSGRAERYPDALASLAAAAGTLDRARAIASDAQKRGLDNSTLNGWIGRLDAYDAALTTLYAALQASGGTLDAEAQADLVAVNRAQAALPADRTGLVLIVTDLGGAPITEALLKIEAARGAVDPATGTID